MSRKHFILNGKKYRYIKDSKTKLYGYCLEAVDRRKGVIATQSKIKGKLELDTLIHEMLHACGLFLDEKWVNKSASEIAQALWDLGYRKDESKSNIE